MTTGLLGALVLDFDPYLRIAGRAVRWETLAIAAAVLVGILVAALLAGRTPGHGPRIGNGDAHDEELGAETPGPDREAPGARQDGPGPDREAPTQGEDALRPGREALDAVGDLTGPDREAPAQAEETPGPGREALDAVGDLTGLGREALDAVGDLTGPGREALDAEAGGPGHLRRDDLLFILLGAVPGAVVLGRLGYGLLHLDYYGAQWRALLDPGQGSMELTLAVVGGTLTAGCVAALLGAPVGRWLHVAIAPLLLVLGLGKAAQALGGSGQGEATAAAWATAYDPPGPWGSLAAEIPAHPAQLYEAAMAVAVLLVVVGLARLTPLRRADGRLFAVGVGLWALGRGLVAVTWRDADVLGPLNAEQLICLAVAAACLGAAAVMTMARRRAPGRVVAS